MKQTKTKEPSRGKTSIRARLNVRQDTPSDYFTVVIQVIRHRQRRVIFTPYRLLREEFDAVRGQAVTHLRNREHRAHIKRINVYLRYHMTLLGRLAALLERSGKPFGAAEIADLYRQRADNRYVATYLRSLVVELRREGKYGSAQAFEHTLSAFQRFSSNQPLLLEDLDAPHVQAFRDYLLRRGLRANTVGFYLGKLRAAYNRSVAEGYMEQDRKPFEGLILKSEKTTKLALNDTLLRQVATVQLTARQRVARDLFLFSFYCRGMSFVDMAYLRHEDIRDGVIRYRRHKTGQLFAVQVLPDVQALLDRYRDGSSPYVLPILAGEDSGAVAGEAALSGRMLYERYLQNRGRYLHLLQDVARKLGPGAHLSFNTARHTWASRARRMDIPISVISEGLGHTTERTTRIYLEEMESRRIDEANRLVTAL